jgi:hypothetical protein
MAGLLQRTLNALELCSATFHNAHRFDDNTLIGKAGGIGWHRSRARTANLGVMRAVCGEGNE